MTVASTTGPPPTLADYASTLEKSDRRGGRRLSAGGSTTSEVRVSVVTIVRNGRAHFERAARSVLAQRGPTIEYIVVDGGSTDGTLEVIQDMGDRIDVWISGRDDGISDAFNKGISLARGAIIGILNSDDWYEPGAVAVMAKLLDDGDADIGYGSLQYWDGDTPTFLVAGNDAALDREMTIGHPTVFARRSAYERLGLFRTDFRQAMDYEWLLRAHAAGLVFRGVDDTVANMQTGGVGDRHWWRSQCEVARARAMHLEAARSRSAFARYVAYATLRGVTRRAADRMYLGGVRRWSQRRLGHTRIRSSK